MAEMSPLNKKLMKDMADSLSQHAKHFNHSEIECLIRMFNILLAEQTEKKTAAGLDRSKFRYILHTTFGLTDDMLLDRIFRAFDKDNDSYISVEEWVEGLSVFLRGTLDEKIKHCFTVYDLNGDGYITRDEMYQLLKNCQVKLTMTDNEPEELLNDLVEIILKKMDYDFDSNLSRSDYDKAVKSDQMLLEAFGACLPDTMNMQAFEQKAFQDAQKP